ncbi:MAG: T9SS type B sorting domain-containing protein, partial [Sphingobacteriales bacterium]
STEVEQNNCEGLDVEGAISVSVSGGTGPFQYTWTVNTTENTPVITSLPNGSYGVLVTDANGCTDTAMVILDYDCCNVFIPSAFTPNGDGRNDEFRLSWKGNLKMIQLLVFNRYGQKVFSTYNLEEGWDGVFNGQPQDLGTYYYYVRVLCGKNSPKEKMFKGDVTLIR